MRKLYLFLFLLFLVFAVSCSTTVGVSYLRPADVNMGQYRNIAIASTVPYRGYISYPARVRSLDPFASSIYVSSSYGSSLPSKVASYATDMVVAALSDTGFYKILSPTRTDTYLSTSYIGYSPSEQLLKAGYDAVMIPRIENMDIDEVVWSVRDGYVVDKKGNRIPVYDYYIKRIATITLSITVVDCKTNSIVASKTYSDKITWSDSFDPGFPFFDTDAYYMFRSMINSFKSTVLQNFVPAMVVQNITLMANKPKIESLEVAYEAVDDGNLEYGYNLFFNSWQESGHIPSGYNAAIIKSALGDYNSALDILVSMREAINNEDVNTLYRMLIAMKESNEDAKAQISGSDSTIALDNGLSIYDYLLNN